MARQRNDATRTRTGATEASPLDDSQEPKGRPDSTGSKPSAGLYLVATPIGNMGDITFRAVEVLRAADVVACEDTRVSGKLMTRLGLHRPLLPYHEHNAAQAGPGLLARLRQGQVVALISDAGAPLVSDPGWRLVQDCRDQGIAVTAIPGPSAVITALQLSGLPADRFLFAGFLPPKSTARRQALRLVAQVPATLLFFESPNRLVESLADMAVVLGDRSAAVCRELTKLHEEIVPAVLSQLVERFTATPARGEIVVVVGPPVQDQDDGINIDDRLRQAVADGASVKDAAALVAAETGHPRREIYARALKLMGGS